MNELAKEVFFFWIIFVFSQLENGEWTFSFEVGLDLWGHPVTNKKIENGEGKAWGTFWYPTVIKMGVPHFWTKKQNSSES